MLKVITEMRALVCWLVSFAVWMTGWIVMPYSDEHPVLGFIHHKAPHIFYAVKGAYVGMWFTIPYLVASMLLSLLYIFAVKHEQLDLGRNEAVFRDNTKNGKDRRVPLTRRALGAICAMPRASKYVFYHPASPARAP